MLTAEEVTGLARAQVIAIVGKTVRTIVAFAKDLPETQAGDQSRDMLTLLAEKLIDDHDLNRALLN